MVILYIIFFSLINLLIFEKLTEIFKLNKKLKLGFYTFLPLFLIFHFLKTPSNTLPNQTFIILLIFSSVLILSHYAGKAVVLISSYTLKENSKTRELFKEWNKVWATYLSFGMVYVFQILTIIKNYTS